MKAADVDTDEVLAAIRATPHPGIGAGRWEIYAHFPDIPEKVVQAKLRRLIAKGVINGCGCGCRGAFTIKEQEQGKE